MDLPPAAKRGALRPDVDQPYRAYPHVAGVEVDGDVVRLVGYAVLGEELDDVVLRDELLVQVEGGVGVAA
eukprot:3545899-Pyramimonas_sp.AAC.1